jgi:hypothetical protein
MFDPKEFIDIAVEFRRQAKKPGPLADRARMVILAEHFEELAMAYADEMAAVDRPSEFPRSFGTRSN